MKADLILEFLDSADKAYEFLKPGNEYVYFVGARLHALRNDDDWAIVIDELAYNPNAGTPDGIANYVFAYGSCMKNESLTFEHFVVGDNDVPLFDPEDPEFVNDTADTFLLRGKPCKVEHDPKFYENKGILLMEPPRIWALEFMRGLLPEKRNELFLTDDYLQSYFKVTLKPFLLLDEWSHPGVLTPPSKCGTFKMLAEALEKNDPGLYKPTSPPTNTWAFWDDESAPTS